MNQEIFCIVKDLNKNDINTQLAMQCAPVIKGVKISNLLIIPKENEQALVASLSGTGLMYYRMFRYRKGTTYLIFRRMELEEYIRSFRVQSFLKQMGYMDFTIGRVLAFFQKRYCQYMTDHKNFPHEMGLLLGYPVEDVVGFVENAGENFLYSGYWKVYSELNQKLELFCRYDDALREVIRLVAQGIMMGEICRIYDREKKYAS